MKITNINPQYKQNTQFKGATAINDLTKVIPNTKVFKNLTQLDKNCFTSYLYSMQFRLKTNAEEIKNLFKLDGDEFFESTYLLLANKLGLPKEILPPVYFQAEDNIAPLSYLPNQNVILRNPDFKNISKAELFGHIRHELQHFVQNLYILRHETLGETAVEIYTKNKVDDLKNGYKYFLENNIPVEVYKSYLDDNDEKTIEQSIQLYTALLNKETDIETAFKDAPKLIKEDFEEYRNLVIEKLGMIKKDSLEAKKAEKFFEDFCNINYFDSEGKIDLGKYVTSAVEIDALLAGQVATFEANGGGCLFRELKEEALDFLSQEDSNDYKSVKKALEEINKS